MRYLEKRNNTLFGLGDPFRNFLRMPLFEMTQEGMKTDIREQDGNYLFEIDMPGFNKEQIKIHLENEYLTIEAEQNSNKEETDKEGNFIRKERHYGSCSRSYYVGDIDPKAIKAKYENGILTVQFPKAANRIETKNPIEIE